MNAHETKTRTMLAAALCLALLSVSAAAVADSPRGTSRGSIAFAPRGRIYSSLPRESVPIRYRGSPYYYRGGEWYRPRGAGFLVIAPPFGAVVPFLPGIYSTFWFGGIPYYWANDTYYLWRPEVGGYVVTRPPAEVSPSTRAPAANASIEPFIYPKNGQSEQQQATDRYECHRWAATQANFDPTQPSTDPSTGPAGSARDAYVRAFSACLEGRGYSVK